MFLDTVRKFSTVKKFGEMRDIAAMSASMTSQMGNVRTEAAAERLRPGGLEVAAGDCVLIDPVTFEGTDDFPLAHDQHPVREQDDLLHLGGDNDHAHPPAGEGEN